IALAEAAVGEAAEGVDPVCALVHRARLLGPGERIRRGDPPDDLRVPALGEPVLRPRAREVLRRADLAERHAPSPLEPTDAVAVRVPGEVADQVLVPTERVDEAFPVVGLDPEVGTPGAHAALDVEARMVPERHDRLRARRREILE